MLHEYPQQIVATLEQHKLELAAIANGEPVGIKGPIATDVLKFLAEVGTATIERIARERGYSHTVSERIVDALAGSLLVETGRTARGSLYAKFIIAEDEQRSQAG
jgi:hypothetical protein